MTDRLQKLCKLLTFAPRFVDVGCDHGYCTEYMLKNGLCEHALVTDVSAECLKKAQVLLQGYIQNGKCSSLCTNGLQGVDNAVDEVLIAGMGGMEILQILQNGFIPKRFVFQPMRDSRKLREYLVRSGCHIERDYTFYSDKQFYDVIVGTREGEACDYSEEELEYGKENLSVRSQDFLRSLQEKIRKKQAILDGNKDLSATVCERLQGEIEFLQGVIAK